MDWKTRGDFIIRNITIYFFNAVFPLNYSMAFEMLPISSNITAFAEIFLGLNSADQLKVWNRLGRHDCLSPFNLLNGL
jgi:hypothetical protein